MSLLTMVKKARLRTNQPAITTAFGNTDTGVMQQIELLQDIGDELAERNQWQALNISGKITGDGVTTIWPFPMGTLVGGSDFSSDANSDMGAPPEATQIDFGGLSNGLQFVSSVFPLQPLVGPVTNEQMAALKAFPPGLLRPVWRVINNCFEFWPALALGEIAAYNYYSTNWILNAAGQSALEFAADTDVSLIDEKILISGLIYRWLAAKGLDYADAERRYERRIALADGRQDTGREVSMSRHRSASSNTWPASLPVFDGSASEGFDFGNF